MWTSGNFYAINGITHFGELCFQALCECACMCGCNGGGERAGKGLCFFLSLLSCVLDDLEPDS